MSAARNIIKLAILDFDGCLLHPEGEASHLLSEELMAIINNNHYQGWYGCTHRCYLALSDFYSYWINALQRNFQQKQLDIDPYNLLTTRIVENAEKFIGKCLAISTPDDSGLSAFASPSEEQCGFGYNLILTPYENEVLNNNKNRKTPYQPQHRYPLFSYYGKYEEFNHFFKSKNTQLIQIMHHARKKYGPEPIIEMHFFDDVKDLCIDIQKISLSNIPPHLFLKSFHYESYKMNSIHFDRPIATAGFIDVNKKAKSADISLGSTAVIANTAKMGLQVALGQVDNKSNNDEAKSDIPTVTEEDTDQTLLPTLVLKRC